MPQEFARDYKEILRQYVLSQTEQNLYIGQNFSRQLIEKNIAPEDVIGIHKAALEEIFPDLPEQLLHSFDLLIEVMIRYGLSLKEHESLLKKQEEMKMEMDLAANVQETMLKTKIPHLHGFDIGLVSIPAKKMNGDYIYFVSNDDRHADVAVADVIGKGIPAALCMSMIKFAMDSLQHSSINPDYMLDMMNGIVEKNMDDSMFISMFYGRIDIERCCFTFASAGHEPALLYRAAEDRFEFLEARGVLLGVDPSAVFEQHEVTLDEGDFIVIMTDGVTESRTKEGFISQETLLKLIRDCKDLRAQEMTESIFQQLAKPQEFELRDDFTLVVFKKS